MVAKITFARKKNIVEIYELGKKNPANRLKVNFFSCTWQ